MTELRRRLPATALGKVRLAAMAFGCLSLVQLAQVGHPVHPPAWHGASAAAIVLLGVVLIATYRRRRMFFLDPVLSPALVVLGGSGLMDPINTVGLTMGVVVAQSLYGSHRAWIIRSIGALLTMPIAVALTPVVDGRPIAWNSATVLGILPQIALMTVMMRGLFATLRRQDQAFAREAVLARAGGQLLGVNDPERIQAIAAKAAADLAACSPGVEAAPDGIAARATGRRAVPQDIVDAFQSLANQVALVQATCAVHAELSHQANHDALTALPNRTLFMRRLAAAMDADRAAGTNTVALLNIDLDDFKKVNDVYGHAAGDELLVEVSQRLAEIGGPESFTARFGGDEFALLLTKLDDLATAEQIADQVCRRLIEPLRLDVATVSVGASIGVAAADNGLTAGDLLRCADIAMYSAKARGKNRVERFTAGEHGDIGHHRMLEDHFAHAIDRGEISPLFQPYVDVRTGEYVGIEALACWQHPSLGIIRSDELMQLAERTGRSVALGTHILRAACREGAVAVPPGAPALPIGVNVTARQVLDPGFPEVVAGALGLAGLAPELLTLEIVESELLDDPAAGEHLRLVTATGVRVALDHFGTGYVSLGSQRSFPIAQVKIDPAFVAGPRERLQLVVSVAHLLCAETVVQGVDTPDDLLDVPPDTWGQGTHFAAAMPASDLREWLARTS